MQTIFKHPDGQICGIFFPELIPAQFVHRDNRFRLTVKLDTGKHVAAHLANPGRLQELLIPGKRIWLSEANKPQRKTAYSAQLIELENQLISLNSQLPNQLIEKALHCGIFPEFDDFPYIRREVTHGNSRLDFFLSNATQRCWVEVKSVTLVEQGVAGFPDAPTKRGRKHLLELIDVIHQGDRAAVIFVIQRLDATSFSPHDATDPDFGAALRQAKQAGVEIIAIACEVNLQTIVISHRVRVDLDAPSS